MKPEINSEIIKRATQYFLQGYREYYVPSVITSRWLVPGDTGVDRSGVATASVKEDQSVSVAKQFAFSIVGLSLHANTAYRKLSEFYKKR